MDNIAVRMCIRVSDNPFMGMKNLSAVRRPCSQCDEPVWMDEQQVLSPAVRDLPHELWCVHCVLADPQLGPSLILNLPQQVREFRATGAVTPFRVVYDDDSGTR